MCRKNGVNGAWYRPQFQTPPGGLGAYPQVCGHGRVCVGHTVVALSSDQVLGWRVRSHFQWRCSRFCERESFWTQSQPGICTLCQNVPGQIALSHEPGGGITWVINERWKFFSIHRMPDATPTSVCELSPHILTIVFWVRNVHCASYHDDNTEA